MKQGIMAVRRLAAMVLLGSVCQTCAVHSGPARTPGPGQIIFQCLTPGGAPINPPAGDWPGFAHLERPSPEQQVLCVEASGDAGTDAAKGPAAAAQRDVLGRLAEVKASTHVVNFPIDPSWRGWGYELRAYVRAADVPTPPVPWEGVRLVVNYQTPTLAYGQSINGLSGGFNWQTVHFTGRIPADAQQVSLSLGLIANAGRAWFRDVRIVLTDPPRVPSANVIPPDLAAAGHAGVSRLRGLNIEGNPLRDPDVAERLAGQWGANLLKYSFQPPSEILADADPARLNAWLDEQFQITDAFIEQAGQAGALVVLQLCDRWHNPKHGGNDLFYEEPRYAEQVVGLWEKIARRYKGRREIWGFELMNESSLRLAPATGCPDYQSLMESVVRAVRRIDGERTLIVQPEEWWGVRAFERLRPIHDAHVVYAVHFYSPFALTHQGVSQRRGLNIRYPGWINGVWWDKRTLAQALQPARDFQQAHNVPMFVSEFSCIRWAPDGSAVRWLRDAIDIFEDYQWDWMYHSALGWDGWSVECGDDPDDRQPTAQPTDRKQLLLGWFARNQHHGQPPVGWGMFHPFHFAIHSK
ncbi:MAG: glycoside hydrolase family 5 protein [Phycisphaerales bacterium]